MFQAPNARQAPRREVSTDLNFDHSTRGIEVLKKRPIEAKKLELGFLVLCELALEEHDATRAGDVEVWLRVLRPVLVVEQDPRTSFENETISAAPVG